MDRSLGVGRIVRPIGRRFAGLTFGPASLMTFERADNGQPNLPSRSQKTQGGVKEHGSTEGMRREPGHGGDDRMADSGRYVFLN